MKLAEELEQRIKGKPPMTAKEALDSLIEKGLIEVVSEYRYTGMMDFGRNKRKTACDK